MAVGATDAGVSVIGSDSSADVGFSPGDGVTGIAGRYICGHTLWRRFAVGIRRRAGLVGPPVMLGVTSCLVNH